MWISKGLGHGFRVGTTIRTRPTQAQLKILDNAKFIENIQKRFRDAFTDYLMQNGYYVDDMRDLAEKEIDDDVYNPIRQSVDEFKDVMRLIQDGGSLTEKRKERLLNSVYGVEDLLTGKNKLKELKTELNNNKPQSFLLAALLSFLGMIFIIPQDFSGINKEIANFLKSIILFMWSLACIYFVNDFKQDKIKSRDEVIQRIKESCKSVFSLSSLESPRVLVGDVIGILIAGFVVLTSVAGMVGSFYNYFFKPVDYPIQGIACVVCGDGYMTEYNGVPLSLAEKDMPDYKKYAYRGKDFSGLKKWILKNTDSSFFHVLSEKDSMNDLDELDECRRIDLFTIFNNEFCRAYSYYLEHEKYSKVKAKEYAYASAYFLLTGFLTQEGSYKKYLESMNKIKEKDKNFRPFITKEHVKMAKECYPQEIKDNQNK